MAPEQLWILNPRKLLRRQIDPVPSTSTEKVTFEFINGSLEILIMTCVCSLKHLRRKDNHFFLAKIVGSAMIQRNLNL